MTALPRDDGRARLVAAARAVAKESGARGFSLRDVARQAGMSPAACYRFFASKQALIGALAAETSAELSAQMQKAAQEETSRRERVMAAAAAYLSYALAHAGVFQALFETAEAGGLAPEQAEAAASFSLLFAELSGRPDLGACLWAAIHGHAELIARGFIDVGQRELGSHVLASRGQTLLRGLIETLHF